MGSIRTRGEGGLNEDKLIDCLVRIWVSQKESSRSLAAGCGEVWGSAFVCALAKKVGGMQRAERAEMVMRPGLTGGGEYYSRWGRGGSHSTGQGDRQPTDGSKVPGTPDR